MERRGRTALLVKKKKFVTKVEGSSKLVSYRDRRVAGIGTPSQCQLQVGALMELLGFLKVSIYTIYIIIKLIGTITGSSRPCTRCVGRHLKGTSRTYAAAAAAPAQIDESTQSSQSTKSSPASDPQHAYSIHCGTILTRPPLLTRRQTDFESAFFFYQKRLNERLTLPFITSIYFKQDTARQLDWLAKMKERQGSVAKELGVYQGKKSQGWDDELLVNDPLSKQETLTDILLKDSEMRVSEDAEEIREADRVPAERPQPRETEADESGNVKRLDRKLDRTLYLVVKGKDGDWRFPSSTLDRSENLYQVSYSNVNTTFQDISY
jgi:large subunit ribosomal protein L46